MKVSDNDDSDATSSNSSETVEDSDDAEESLDNSEAIAQLYAACTPRRRATNDGLSRRASDKTASAILAARRALLLQSWTTLLAALKDIEASLKLIVREDQLAWRIPILSTYEQSP